MQEPRVAARPRPSVLVAAGFGLVLAAGCSAGGTADDAAPSSAPTGSAPSSAPSAGATVPGSGDGLAAGLLPAEAFGDGAEVVPLSREQLRRSAGLAADPADLDVTPESCAQVLTATQPPIDDYDDAAAQRVTAGATTTVEVLLEGEITGDAVPTLRDAVEACPEARVGFPDVGEATVTFEDLDAPALGDATAAVRYTTTFTQGGQEASVPALVGLVQDGDRVITLLTIATDGSDPDAAAFTSLLEQAFEVQAERLG